MTIASSRRRRVALVTQGLAIGGGVPSVARWLRDGLTAAGYDVDMHDLATSRSDPYSRRLADARTWRRGSLRGPFDHTGRVQSWGANAVELEPMRYHPRSELTRALRAYDLIQVVAGGAALACAALGAGPPVFLQVATRLKWERQARRAARSLPSRAWGDAMTAWASRLETRALSRVSGIFVENAEMLAFVSAAGLKSAVLAPPGVDTDRFHPGREGWNADSYLLSVCRLAEPRKRLDRLIDAYRELVRAHPTAPELVLAGRGQLPDELRLQIADAGLASRITVRPDVASEDLPELYRRASVYVQASDEEGLGISMLEAMASGLPVVATDTAGARECVVTGTTGWLVAQGDTAAFADRLKAVLAPPNATLGSAARRRCEAEFASSRALSRFMAAYDQFGLA